MFDDVIAEKPVHCLLQALFESLPKVCGVAREECVGVEEFRGVWGGCEGVNVVPLYCPNRELVEMGREGAVGGCEGVRGEDTRSISHQVYMVHY